MEKLMGYTQLRELLEKAKKVFIKDEAITKFIVSGYIEIWKDCLNEDL